MRPRGAAAAEPEGRRAGQPSPRAPCRCPDLPLHVPVPPPAPLRPSLSLRPPKPQIIFGFFSRSFKVTSSLQPRGLSASFSSLLASSPVLLENPQGTGLGKAWRAGEGCGGMRRGRGRRGPTCLIYLQLLLMLSLVLFAPSPLFSPPSGTGGVFLSPFIH